MSLLNFFKAICKIKGADTLRYVMANVYDRCYDLAEDGGQPRHSTAILNALAHRFEQIGRPFDRIEQWLEVAPFVGMSQEDAKEALGEYMVYLEMPEKCKLDWLKPQINDALRETCQTEDIASALTFLQANLFQYKEKIPWVDLLDEDVKVIYRLKNQ
ncbi:MAG: hypothetical protein GY804_07670 [Alphaproteobacteria bacterium]|nr:hypothetical protein [Alphaproteobacteria bacterium]